MPPTSSVGRPGFNGQWTVFFHPRVNPGGAVVFAPPGLGQCRVRLGSLPKSRHLTGLPQLTLEVHLRSGAMAGSRTTGLRFAALIRVSTEHQEKQGESLVTQRKYNQRDIERLGGIIV